MKSRQQTELRLSSTVPRRDCRRGVTTVEVAMMFPVVLTFFMASIEFGRLNMVRNSADNAAYEGAREGMLPGGTPRKMRQAARRIIRAAGVENTNIIITPSVINDDTEQVTVTVRVRMNRNKWGFMNFTSGRIERTCTLTRERALVVP